VHLGVAFVADPQAAEVVQVREAALDDPALAAEPGAVLAAASCDAVLDAAVVQQAPVLVVVIAAVGDDEIGLLAGPAALAGDRSGVQVVQQRHQLRDVVAVTARQRDRERDAGGVDEKVVLGTRAGTINRGWPRQEPPKRARTCEPSTAARDQSIAPTALSFVSSLWCSASQTPACCQSRSRRQHVTPDP
jgi:hypothetical protein